MAFVPAVDGGVRDRSAHVGLAMFEEGDRIADDHPGRRGIAPGVTQALPNSRWVDATYCDDIAARIVTPLGEGFASLSANGDGGATFTHEQVRRTVTAAGSGAVRRPPGRIECLYRGRRSRQHWAVPALQGAGAAKVSPLGLPPDSIR